MRVKVCGITNIEDAELAGELGANALGFIFYEKSPRYITPTQAKEIVSKLTHKLCIAGIFVNENADNVISIASECGLGVVQLHGEESPEDCKKCLDAGFKVIKGVRVKAADNILMLKTYLGSVTGFLLDAYSNDAYGGTGMQTDWEFARNAAQHYKVFLSGGLKPENVVDAVNFVQPHAIDVCSGVEESPGKKDKKKMKQFFDNLNELNYES